MKHTTLFLAAALASALLTLPAWAIERPVSTPLPKPPATKPTRPFTPIVVQTAQQPQTQKQAQHQAQSQKVHVAAPTLQMSSSLSLDVQAQERNPVASAFAPGLAVSNGTCFGTSGAGVQGASFGLSLGGPSLDEGCDTRYDAAALISVGEMDSAIERLCMKPEIREARKAANRPCLADRPHAGASFTGVCLDPSGQPYADPLVAARACPVK